MKTIGKTKSLWMAVLLGACLASLYPCDITMETSPITAGGKNQMRIKLFVELIHRRCPVNIEKTRLLAAGLAIEQQGQWKKVAAGIYQKELIVSLNGKAKGEIRILRECPKTGRQEEVLGVVRI